MTAHRTAKGLDPDKTLEYVRPEEIDEVDVLTSEPILAGSGRSATSVMPFAVNIDLDQVDFEPQHESTTIILRLKAMAHRRRKFVPIVLGAVGVAAAILLVAFIRHGASSSEAERPVMAALASRPVDVAVQSSPAREADDAIPPVVPIASTSPSVSTNQSASSSTPALTFSMAPASAVPIVSIDSLPRVETKPKHRHGLRH